MKRYNVINDRKGGVKITESNTGHWMLAGEVERMLEDMEPSADGVFMTLGNPHYPLEDYIKRKGKDNGN